MSMPSHRTKHVRNVAGKNKVWVSRPDIIPDRDAVDMLLAFFHYPALLTKKALESLIHRERKAREKQGHSCRI
jgi:hypothetical protein